MLRVNHYKKVCYLTDSEVNKITNFIKDMFGVDQIISVSLYLDQNNDCVCEIEGFDKPVSNVIGSCIKHDISKKADLITSVEKFKEFAENYNKKYSDKED